MVPVLWFTPFLKEKQSFKWKQPGLRNYLGTILEELIDQPSWIINTALQPVSQPAEKQVHPLNQSTARETGEEEWNMCVHVKKNPRILGSSGGFGNVFFPCQLQSHK